MKAKYVKLIMNDYDLSLQENAVFSYILSLAQKKGFCYATNKHICESLNIKDRTLFRIFASLEDKEFITRVTKSVGNDGKERKIYINPKYRQLGDTLSVT
jgi:DNA-binding MarR family transcriptional regulator